MHEKAMYREGTRTYIDGEIHRPVPHGLPNLLDDTVRTCATRCSEAEQKEWMKIISARVHVELTRESARVGYAFRVERRETDKRTDCIDFPGFDSLESRCIVILVIRWAREGRPNGAVLLESNKLGSKCYDTQRECGDGRMEAKGTCN